MIVTMIGGDARFVACANRLRTYGHTVHCYAMGEHTPLLPTKAELVILPLPYTKDHTTLYAPLSSEPILLESLQFPAGCRILCGKADFTLRAMAESHGWLLEDYGCWEPFQIGNAIPSAEGAIFVAMQQLTKNLCALPCVVYGFGRIARHLVRLLLAFGANVTVCARKSADRILAQSWGAKTLPFAQRAQALPACQLLFNTVPTPVLTAEDLELLPKDTLLIDLASAPGGIDFSYAAQLGLRTTWALSLPALYAPHSAGILLADLVAEYLSALGGAQ